MGACGVGACGVGARRAARLVAAQTLLQDDHAEDGRRERLRLVEQLQQLRAEVGGGDELQVVLQRVAQRWDGDLERVQLALPYVGMEHGAAAASLRAEQDGEAEEELEQLGTEHSDGHRVL